MKKLFFFILVIINFFSFSQQKKIDSLKNILTKELRINEKVKILDLLNHLLISSSTPDTSIIYFEQMAQLSKETDNIPLETKSYRYLSESFMRKNDINKALLFANKSLHINDSLQIVNGYLTDINQLGRIYHHFQKYSKAIETYNKGIYYYNLKHEGKAISTIYGNLGIAYNRLNDNEKALECYIKQAKLAETYKDITQKSNALYNIAWLYMELEQYDKAEDYYFKALNDSLDVSLKTYIYRNYHGLGLTYSRWGKYDMALKYNNKALSFFSETGNKLYELDVLNNIANVYLKQNKKTQALKYSNKSLEIANNLNNKYVLNGVNSTLSNIYMHFKDYTNAEIILKTLIKDTTNPSLLNKKMEIDVYKNIYIINKVKNNYKKALFYLEKEKKLSNTLLKEQRDNKIAEVYSKYQNEKIEKELVTKEKIIVIEKNKNQKYMIYILLLFVLSFFSIIAYRFYYSKYLKNRNELINTVKKIKKIERELFQTKNLNSELVLKTEFNKKEFNYFLMKKYFIKKPEIIEIWESIANGISRKEFATKNKISENTIKSWRNELYSNLKKATFTKERYSDYKAVIEYYNNLRWYESQLSSN